MAAVNHRWYLNTLLGELRRVQGELDHMVSMRKADRAGRVRAEQELRRLQLQLASTAVLTTTPSGGEPAAAAAAGEASGGGQPRQVSSSSSSIVYPFKPIGHVRSCFSQRCGPTLAPLQAGKQAATGMTGITQEPEAASPLLLLHHRNGTPRQPLLVDAARCKLQLSADVPAACLDGLTQYSHAWLLYVFHANTDLAKCLGPDRSGVKARIAVPRLNGGRMGVLATRSPHRPVPIGLSVARVLAVEGRTVLLGGADIVDGSPVLDIKPYVRYCDSIQARPAAPGRTALPLHALHCRPRPPACGASAGGESQFLSAKPPLLLPVAAGCQCPVLGGCRGAG